MWQQRRVGCAASTLALASSSDEWAGGSTSKGAAFPRLESLYRVRRLLRSTKQVVVIVRRADCTKHAALGKNEKVCAPLAVLGGSEQLKDSVRERVYRSRTGRHAERDAIRTTQLKIVDNITVDEVRHSRQDKCKVQLFPVR